MKNYLIDEVLKQLPQLHSQINVMLSIIIPAFICSPFSRLPLLVYRSPIDKPKGPYSLPKLIRMISTRRSPNQLFMYFYIYFNNDFICCLHHPFRMWLASTGSQSNFMILKLDISMIVPILILISFHCLGNDANAF